MPQEVKSMRTRDNMRANWETDRMEFVKVTMTASGEEFVMRANLPVGRGFNEKGQPLEYINMGFKPAAQYDAEQNSLQAEKKREALKEKK